MIFVTAGIKRNQSLDIYN